MKKTIILLLAAVILLLPCAGFCAGQFATAGDLWQHWQMQITDYYTQCSYPDHVCGAWSTDGGMANLTFGITDDEQGEAARQNILSQIADKDTASFEYMEFSYRELWEVRLEIEKSLGSDNGMVGIGIYEMENRIHIDMDKDHEKTDATMLELSKKYPGMITFELGGPVVLTAEEVVEDSRTKYNYLWYISAFAVLAAILLAVFRKKIFVHADGSISASGRLTSSKVKAAVKSADIAPPPGLGKKIEKTE